MSDRDQALSAMRAKFAKRKSEQKEPIRGLGDVVHRVTDALGMEHCDECERRRQRMNRWFRLEGKDEG
jgi:hypothetical protein